MSRYFTPATKEELAELPGIVASLDQDARNGKRLQPLYNRGGFALLVLIRLLCWKTVPGPWTDDGDGNKLQNKSSRRELLAFASGYPTPMNLGVSVFRIGWKNGEAAIFKEVVQYEDGLSDAELHAWFIAALRRASLVLNGDT